MHQLSNTIGQHDDIGVSLPNLSPLGSNINLYALYDIYVFSKLLYLLISS